MDVASSGILGCDLLNHIGRDLNGSVLAGCPFHPYSELGAFPNDVLLHPLDPTLAVAASARVELVLLPVGHLLLEDSGVPCHVYALSERLRLRVASIVLELKDGAHLARMRMNWVELQSPLSWGQEWLGSRSGWLGPNGWDGPMGPGCNWAGMNPSGWFPGAGWATGPMAPNGWLPGAGWARVPVVMPFTAGQWLALAAVIIGADVMWSGPHSLRHENEELRDGDVQLGEELEDVVREAVVRGSQS